MKVKSVSRLPWIVPAFVASSVFFLSGNANAQLFWDSNGATAGFGNTTGTWGTSGFWNTDSTGGGAGTFGSATSATDTVHFGTATLNYDNSAIAIASGGVTVGSMVYGAGQTRPIVIGTAGNTLTLGGASPSITVNNPRFHQVILSPVVGTAGLTKEGAGTLVLRGANIYSGGTTVNAGTLSFGTIAAKAPGTHTFNAGTTLALGYDGAGLFTATDIQNAFAGSFTGDLAGINLADPSVKIAIDTTPAAKTLSVNLGPSSRSLVKIPTGSNLTLTGANQYSGRTVVGGGSALIVNSLGNIADTSSNIGINSTVDLLDGSRLDIATTSASDKHFNVLGNALIFPQNITFTHTGNISTETAGLKTITFGTNDVSLLNVKDFQGVISDGSGIIAVGKINPGAIWFSGNNTYSGATTVGTGTLIISHANALGSAASGTTVSNGATLGLQNNITIAEAITLTTGPSGNVMLRNYSGNNTVGGVVTASGVSTTTRIASDAGSLTLSGGLAITGTAHQFVLQGSGNLEISGQITGTAFITSATNGTGVRKFSNDTNNYTGQTRVNGATLEFTSIENVGAAASSLGAPALADSVINLGFDANDATLRYVGTSFGGHSSDRVVRLNYAATSAAHYTIEANGTGPLVLTAGVTAASGSKTLTLSGPSTEANSIGVIANGGSGAISVAKTGTGTWVLAGANTYTGATTISGGTLVLDAVGSIATSASVNIGAAGTLDTAGQATYAVPAAQPLTINIDPTGAGASGKIAAAGLDITNAVVTINPTAPLDDAVYVLATYTSLTGSAFAAPLPSVPAGYTLNYAYEGNKIALVQSSSAYDSWASLKGLDGSPGKENGKTQDPDKDGRNNLAEFAFNGDPLSASNNGLVASLVQDASLPAGPELTLVVAVRNGAVFSGSGSPSVQTSTVDGITYTIEGSLDLTTFPGSAVSHADGPTATAPVATGLPDLTGTDWKYHTFKLDASEGLPSKGFLRARTSE